MCVSGRVHDEEKELPDNEAEEKKAAKEISKINKIRIDLTQQYQAVIKVSFIFKPTCNPTNADSQEQMFSENYTKLRKVKNNDISIFCIVTF